jgi:hypothetical protein
MNGSCQTPDEILCACCEGVRPETPQPISNRPALSSVAYRVGTWATFKASMIAALADPDNAALGALRTRDDSDFSIALIDAWAVVADILSFYQERIANESWLRTAVDERSVFELARLVGYRPSPGVAASAFLAFTMSDSAGAPDNVLIAAGTRVQSVPGPGQMPQVFETSRDLTARISFNAIRAQTTLPWSLSAGAAQTTLQGTNRNLNAGDGVLFMTGGLQSSLTSEAADFHRITSVAIDANAGTTTITWDGPLASGLGTGDSDVFVYVFRKKAALFGVQAPDPNYLKGAPATQFPAGNKDWSYAYTVGSMQVSLDASYAGLAPTPGGEPQWVVLTSPGRAAVYPVSSAEDFGATLYALTSKTTRLTLGAGQVLGNNSDQLVNSGFQGVQSGLGFANGLSVEGSGQATPKPGEGVLGEIVADTRSATAWVQSELLPTADPPFVSPWSGSGTWSRQAGLLKPVEGSSLEIMGGQTLNGAQPVAISGKRLRLRVNDSASAAFVPQGTSGTLAASDGQIFLIESFPPGSLAGNNVWQVTALSDTPGTLTVPSSAIVMLPADKSDEIVSESAVISQTSVAGAVTTLAFDQALSRIYDRATVTVNANAVAATHGETMHEILGSGDATNSALQFTLKQSPLTYVSSSSRLGVQTTLQVWVNNLQWHETDNFLTSQPADRIFVTRPAPGGSVIVQFGDGEEGSRPPTGQMNVRAMYRKGIGAAGLVGAGQLSQPLDRPQGLKSVVNPDAATGGADPDSAADARTSAPLHVLTLDRVVSLEDYQNFARAFGGIDKALATWTWFGKTRRIFLTIAGANGSQFNAGDPTAIHLTQALQSSGNPFVPLQVASYIPVLFEVAGNVLVDNVNYDPKEVLGRVWLALTTGFAFEMRGLGQGVAQSEVISLIQQTAGVVAVELTAFNRSGQPASALPAVLQAGAPVTGANSARAAELLLLDPASRGNIGAWS